ncbi:MAG: dihydrofolate reductase family protein [Rhizobacter sp.]
MAKLIVSQLMSLDGHLAGPNGELERLPMGPAFDQHNVELLRNAGTLLFGRTTFGMFQGFWPQVEQDAGAHAVLREIASLTHVVHKLVVSDTLALGPADPWRDAEVVSRAGSRERIAQLKASAGHDLLMYGGTKVWQDLYAGGLVDELHLLVGNVVLGNGVPVFAPGVARPMTLLGQRRLPDSEIVALRYAVA